MESYKIGVDSVDPASVLPKYAPYSCITVMSSDTEFMCRLIEWLSNQEVEPDSTTVRFVGEDSRKKTKEMNDG